MVKENPLPQDDESRDAVGNFHVNDVPNRRIKSKKLDNDIYI